MCVCVQFGVVGEDVRVPQSQARHVYVHQAQVLASTEGNLPVNPAGGGAGMGKPSSVAK